MPANWIAQNAITARAPVTIQFPVAARCHGLSGAGISPIRLLPRMKKKSVQKKKSHLRPISGPSHG